MRGERARRHRFFQSARACFPAGGARLAVGRIVVAAKIVVAGNEIEPALKALKKQMLKDGIFQEMKRRAFYEKPSVKRKRKSAHARKRRLRALKRARAHDSE